ncbi:hypothetical protein BaRGS_00013868 [Batillaria attramentaria]|uniref:Uncharacterized protein n=1 Tax=Batillaria attramentaria TaxID=370345 RepID=A0ABD0L6K7_9CAEN
MDNSREKLATSLAKTTNYALLANRGEVLAGRPLSRNSQQRLTRQLKRTMAKLCCGTGSPCRPEALRRELWEWSHRPENAGRAFVEKKKKKKISLCVCLCRYSLYGTFPQVIPASNS